MRKVTADTQAVLANEECARLVALWLDVPWNEPLPKLGMVINLVCLN